MRKRAHYLEHDRRAKLTEAQVCEIRRRYRRDGVLQVELAREYGVSQSTISAITRFRARWTGDESPKTAARSHAEHRRRRPR